MKKTLFVLVPVLMLVGAGCSSSSNVNGQGTASTPQEAAPAQTQAQTGGQNSAAVSSSADVSANAAMHANTPSLAPVVAPLKKIVTNVSLSISAFAYHTPSVTVNVGDSVTWTNQDSMAHTVTADDGAFGSGSIAAGGTFSHTFTKAGTYSYHCTLHPQMKGVVIVR